MDTPNNCTNKSYGAFSIIKMYKYSESFNKYAESAFRDEEVKGIFGGIIAISVS